MNDASMPARIGRYRVLRVLGEGGMGVVYAAFDDELARAVAIKLVHARGSMVELDEPSASGHGPSPALSLSRGRMRREAQSMAQVSHPHVVQVHDVGEHEGELFLAMELVHGTTLDAWLAELGPPRTRAARRREVLDAFVAAGRGLAAAHAAGLVHRDFKPSNVLIGEGVVKVGDFGLARARLDVDEPSASASHLREVDLAARMTETGALLGTPAYLSPEQLAGKPATAASDQFAFCVALYEALTGQRPFAGDDMRTLAANLLAGRRAPLPEGLALPAWLLGVIDRGLAAEPSERWPSMSALLDGLLDDPAKRKRRRGVLGLLALGLVALAGTLTLRELDHQRTCERLGAALDERWSTSAKQTLAAAFAATDAPDPGTTWTRAESRIDAWVETWRAARIEVCHEARDEPERASLAAACLEHERWQLEALLDVFASADRSTVLDAIPAIGELPELARCRDLAWLASDPSLQPNTSEDETSLAPQRELARASALGRTGHFEDALVLAERALVEAEQRGDALLEAEALVQLGELHWRMADFARAEQRLHDAFFLAARIEHDHVAYLAARDLSWVVGVRLVRASEGRAWLEHARISLARSGQDPEQDPELFERLGELEYAEQRPSEALAAHLRALELREHLYGSEHPLHAESLISIGEIHVALGHPEDALRFLERGRELAVATLGEAHPTVSNADSKIALVYFEQGRIAECTTVLRRALSLRTRALGSEEQGVAQLEVSLAGVLTTQGDELEALLLLEHAVGVLERKLGAAHPETLYATSTLATLRGEHGQLDEAIELLRTTLELVERSPEPDQALLGIVLGDLAYYLAQRGDHAAAIPLWRRMIAIDEQLGPGEIAAAQAYIARSELALGQLDEALVDARSSLALAERHAEPGLLAKVLDGLALVELAREHDDEAGALHARAHALRGDAGSSEDLSGLRAELATLLSPHSR